jgi:hypothetical protein
MQSCADGYPSAAHFACAHRSAPTQINAVSRKSREFRIHSPRNSYNFFIQCLFALCLSKGCLQPLEVWAVKTEYTYR